VMPRLAVWVLFALLFAADLNADWLGPGVCLVAGGPIDLNPAVCTAMFRALLWALGALVVATYPAAHSHAV
jgi:hypothetical protein